MLYNFVLIENHPFYFGASAVCYQFHLIGPLYSCFYKSDANLLIINETSVTFVPNSFIKARGRVVVGGLFLVVFEAFIEI